jgi:hypothetical protein
VSRMCSAILFRREVALRGILRTRSFHLSFAAFAAAADRARSAFSFSPSAPALLPRHRNGSRAATDEQIEGFRR